jgi:hypothetical protein
VNFASTLSSATIAIAGGNANDALSMNSSVPGITSAVSGATLTLAGTASSADYQTALRAVSISAVGTMAPGAHRTISATITICHVADICSAVGTLTVSISPALSNLPTLTVVTGTHVHMQGSPAINIASGAVIANADDTLLQGATVALSENIAGDILNLVPGTPAISMAWDAETGVLQLSGTATLSQYENALRTTTLLPSMESSLDRSVSIVVSNHAGSSSSVPQITVTICAKSGYFNDAAVGALTSCPQGKYQANTCASACNSCGTGTFGSGSVTSHPVDSESHCQQCSAGRFQDQVGQVTCSACAAGTFGTGSQSSTTYCAACEVGQYNDQVAQVACFACAPGYFADTAGSSACTMCSGCKKGEYFTGCTTGTSDSFCAVCSVGTYSECPTGSLNSLCHKGQCTDCLAGKFGSSSVERDSASHCVSCPTGKFQASTAATECATCAAGTFANEANMLTCVACAAGQYQAATEQDSCITCEAGKFGLPGAAQTSSSYCELCPDGKFQEAEGVHGACTSCSAGEFAHVDDLPNTSDEHCIACSPGHYQDEVMFVEQCKACPSLQFQPGSGALQCQDCSALTCPPGQFVSQTCTLTARTADRVCSDIPAVVGISGSIQYVENMPAAKIASAVVVTFAETVSSATITLIGGNANDELIPPPAHAYITSAFSATSATLTLSGSASAAEYQTALRAVRFSTVGDMAGVTSVRPVTASVVVCHVPSEVAAATLLSAAGACSVAETLSISINPVNDLPVVSSVLSTAIYTHGTTVHVASAAVVTDRDHTTLERAVATITSPQVGDVLSADVSAIAGISAVFTASTGVLELIGSAPIAEYQQAIRTITYHSTSNSLSTSPRSISIVVHDGTSSSSSEPLVSVTMCAAAGFYANTGTHLITACPTGSFQAATCASSCTGCGAGKYGKATAAAVAESHCEQCNAGTYQTATGQTSCIACTAGKFGGGDLQDVSTYCHACSAGKMQSGTGETSCVDCAVGRFTASAEATTCTDCPAGRYADAASRAACTACAAGTANALAGQASSGACTACMAGSYAPAEGLTECLAWTTCAAGKFNKDATAHSAGSCEDCAHGTFQAVATSVGEPCSSWTDCSAGWYITGQGTTAAGTCSQCAAGKYRSAGAGDFSSCIACAAGKFGAALGGTAESSCTACAAGHFAATAGASSCTACAADSYGVAGATSCDACAYGEWLPWGACDKTCEGGERTRTRSVESTAPEAQAQCVSSETAACNSVPCPHRVHCQHLKCRFKKTGNGDNYAIQVYHHHKDAPAVHHCKLYNAADGTTECHCHCWQTIPTMLSETIPSWTSAAIRGGN